MFAIAICDDNRQSLLALKAAVCAYMKKNACPYEIKLFPSAKILLDEWQAFDIVFLDIQMEGINGMQAARTIRGKDRHCAIIFVTVLPELVFDAFEVAADNYLVKPLSVEKLTRTLDRILQRREADSARYLMVQKNNALWRVKFDDILYCEVIKRVIYLRCLDGNMDYYETIEHLAKLLPPSFFRCHRSYLVNLKFVQGYKGHCIKMQNSDVVPLSRLRRADFLQAMLHYMEGSGAGGV